MLKTIADFLRILFYSARLILLIPSAAIVLGVIMLVFFPGTWSPMSLVGYLSPWDFGEKPAVEKVEKPIPDADIPVTQAAADSPEPEIWKYAAALAFTLVWTPIMIPAMKMIVARQDNYRNMLGLLGLSAPPCILMLVLLRPWLGNVYTLIGFFLYAGATLLWTGILMNRVAE